MAQLRQEYEKFVELDTEILAIAADSMGNDRNYFEKHSLPFPSLIDDAHSVYDEFDVQSRLVSLGQRPGLFIIDKEGIVRFAYVGFQQWEIPSNQEVLAQLKDMTR